MKQRMIRSLVWILMVGLTIGGVCAVPIDALTAVGKQAALLSVGLQQPTESSRLLIGGAQKQPLQSGGSAVREVALSVVTARPVTGGAGAVPEQKAGGGQVQTVQLSAGESFVQGVAIKNNSKQTVDIAAALQRSYSIGFSDTSKEVQVLITHTHTTESYLGYDAGFYNPDDAARTADPEKNMVAVGNAVAEELRKAGIGVIHDTTIHDQPYDGAYSHSKSTVEAYLKQYPTICVVLDIHRDAIYPSDGVRIKPTTVVDGKKAAQLMVVVGMMNTQKSPNSYTADNLAFGARLQQRLHQQYPGLMRPMLLANARYNQQLSRNMILLEVGSDVNTIGEACYAARLFAGELITVLRKG